MVSIVREKHILDYVIKHKGPRNKNKLTIHLRLKCVKLIKILFKIQNEQKKNKTTPARKLESFPLPGES